MILHPAYARRYIRERGPEKLGFRISEEAMPQLEEFVGWDPDEIKRISTVYYLQATKYNLLPLMAIEIVVFGDAKCFD